MNLPIRTGTLRSVEKPPPKDQLAEYLEQVYQQHGMKYVMLILARALDQVIPLDRGGDWYEKWGRVWLKAQVIDAPAAEEGRVNPSKASYQR